MKIVKIFITIIVIIAVAVAVLFGVLTITEYNPDDTTEAELTQNTADIPSVGESLKIMTWNIGYGALGDNADFFLDGGSGVMTADSARVNENMENILGAVNEIAPDIAMFQEVDVKSMRSHDINEAALITDRFADYDSSFAYNFKCLFIPYPLPPIGYVNGGILTISSQSIDESTRYQLPTPYKWPVRLGNLKRCIVVNRIAVDGTDRELVIVNLHLEAYDDGEGKIAQTQMLREILNKEAEAGNYVIAGGDFNQTFSNVDLSAYPTYEGMWTPGVIDVSDFEGWQLYMDDSVASCRSLDKPFEGADKDSFQYYFIDGFIVSDNITVESVETVDLDFTASDHNPVVMRFVLDKR